MSAENSIVGELSIFWQNLVRDMGSLFPKETGIVSYDELPDAPGGPGDDSNVTKSLDALAAWARPTFVYLEQQFPALIGPIGYKAVRRETIRTDARQGWLWGIGRLYKASGRKGIVTNVKTASGPHGEGRAVDYAYLPLDPQMTPNPDALTAALKGLADSLKSEGVVWGGSWTTLVDPAHWEVKDAA